MYELRETANKVNASSSIVYNSFFDRSACAVRSCCAIGMFVQRQYLLPHEYTGMVNTSITHTREEHMTIITVCLITIGHPEKSL